MTINQEKITIQVNYITLTKNIVTEQIATLVALVRAMDKRQYWQEEHILIDLPQKWFFSQCAILNNKVVGYIICSQKADNLVHIHKYVVDEQYRGMNIGKKMFERLKKMCIDSSVSKISLAIYQDNERGIRFHERNGFVCINKKDTPIGVNITMLVELQ